jgi:hypothetical protein
MSEKQSVWQRLINSLDTKTNGFSGRKLSAVYGNILAGVLVWFYALSPMKSFPLVYGITLTYACLCLGLVTATNIIKFRHGGQKEDTKNQDRGVEPPDTQ